MQSAKFKAIAQNSKFKYLFYIFILIFLILHAIQQKRKDKEVKTELKV